MTYMSYHMFLQNELPFGAVIMIASGLQFQWC